MRKTSYTVLGVMSGTSLDGIDLAVARFHTKGHGDWFCTFVRACTIPYSEDWKNRLRSGHELGSKEMEDLDLDYTRHLGGTIRDYIEREAINDLDLVSSHGHTILHQPDKGLTLQIGNRPEIRDLAGLPVVCDFRVQDVQLGGQGAPLVPIGDRYLYPDYDSCLNLGGFANCSFERNGRRIAFDVCPINIILNPLAEQLGVPYDEGGALARSGKVIPDLIEQLNALDFYKQPAPKSLGLEWVLDRFTPILEYYNEQAVPDLLRTCVEHMATQLAGQLPEGRCLVTGGGAYNDFLIERLKDRSQTAIVIPEDWLIDNKEALVFGLLGILKSRGEVNCLSSVTGASKDHSSGVVYP